MKHYRVYKLNKSSGRIVKGKDLMAPNDDEAMHDACADPDCPVCEVWRGAEKVGTVE
jgi:hypothetical protein